MAQRPLSRHPVTAGVIVAMLTVLLAPAPAAAAVDLLGGEDQQDASDDSSAAEQDGAADGSDESDEQESDSGSGSSDQNLGEAVGDVVNSVTASSDQQAAADGQDPQQVTPESSQGGGAAEPAQPQPQSDSGGGGQSQADASQPQQSAPASSAGGDSASQPAVPSGPRRAARPGVRPNGQPPASAGGSDLDSVDRGAYQPRAPQVLSQESGADGSESASDIAALPSIPVLAESSGDGASTVPNEYVAAACALLVVLAGAHSLHATRRFGVVDDTGL